MYKALLTTPQRYNIESIAGNIGETYNNSTADGFVAKHKDGRKIFVIPSRYMPDDTGYVEMPEDDARYIKALTNQPHEQMKARIADGGKTPVPKLEQHITDTKELIASYKVGPNV